MTTSKMGRIFVITINNPPVNALGHDVRTEISHALHQAHADSDVDGVILHGAGKIFSAGADIREFDVPAQIPFLHDVVHQIENCRKPVAAVIHGAAMGGGLELALACHVRIAADDAQLSLPEVKLGILPGAGGTQRLPRLIGIAAALDIMTSGTPVSSQKAFELGLIDAIEPAATLMERAIATLKQLVAAGDAPRRTLDIAPPAKDTIEDDCAAFLAGARFRGAIAPARIVETVRDGLTRTGPEGLQIERVAFAQLRDGTQAKALRYSFFSDRQATKIPGLEGVSPRTIQAAGIVGAGLMGSGIAITLLSAGIPVVLHDRSKEALERGKATIDATLARNAANGRMSADAAALACSLCTTTETMTDFASVDLVIEAAYETMEVKTALFSALASILKPGAIMASNTSYLDIDEMAAATDRPQDVVGLHFFSPANIMKLLEIVKAGHTAPDVLATALTLAKRIGKTAVVAGNTRGFIGNRMLAVRRDQAEAMILAGTSPYDVDRVIEAFGMPMGPFRMRDLAGLDLGWIKQESHGATIRDRLCEAGRRGQKTSAGFYDYDEKGRALPSASVELIIAGLASDHGLKKQADILADEEILDRLMLPMINEGVRILAEGKALRGSDLDVVWRGGYGWPGWRGGPIYWAQNEGLSNIVARLVAMDITPEPLLSELATLGGDLTEYTNPALVV